MKLKILGCSGGIGGRHLRTTSMLIDNDILIDAGTGVADLSMTEMSLVDHVFVTHSHLDHVATIPFVADTVGGMRAKPLTIHAIPATIETLRKHIFNGSIWPDFSQIPTPKKPFLQFCAIQVGETVDVRGRKITALPANHTVPAICYQIDSGKASLVFSGDTTTNDAFWKVVNRIPKLKYVIIETAFCNQDKELAIASKHLCPSMLADELAKLDRKSVV
jgi:ribonuclease BN (tRNA processing enzyme)